MDDFKLDFLGIGVEKAATYWVADCLREHPEVQWANQKELAFFNTHDQHFLKHKNPRYYRGIDWYSSFFPEKEPGKLMGEYTPTYLYGRNNAKRIKKHFPNVKIICTLRDPVKRAFSQYLHDSSIGIIPEMSFEQALGKHDAYLKKGYYSKYLKNYYQLFNKNSILILLVDDIKKNPEKQVAKLYKFLNLKNQKYSPGSLYKRPNPASIARFPLVNRLLINSEYKMMNKNLEFLHKLSEEFGIRKAVFWATYYLNRKPISREDYPEINPKTEKKLRRKYRKDIQALEKLISRKLKNWY